MHKHTHIYIHTQEDIQAMKASENLLQITLFITTATFSLQLIFCDRFDFIQYITSTKNKL